MPRRLLVTLVAVLALGAAAATGGAWGGAPGYDNWNCNLQVYWGVMNGIPADTGDYFGVQPGATDGYDLIDSKKPSEPFGDYVYAWFERPAWGVGRIMADWRAPITDGTTKNWFVSSITDTWNIKTNLDNGPSGYYDWDCDFLGELEYPIAADIVITWAFGVAETPPYPSPPDDYIFQAIWRGGVNAKPAGPPNTGSPGGATIPAMNTIYDMKVTTSLTLPLWNEAFQPWTADCASFSAADTAKFLFRVINPNTEPTCAVTYTPASPQQAPATFTFTATACCDEPYTFSWAFGDGGTATGNPVSHTYSGGGIYTVTCTVTDVDGQTGTCTAQVEVTECPDPQCCFTYAPANPEPGETVSFTDCSSAPPPQTIVSWQWTFGDGGSDTVQNPDHVYAAEGIYEVCLTVTNDCGKSATCCQLVDVKRAELEPVCCIEGPVEVTVCEPATWSSECSYDPDGGDIVSRAWYLDVPCEALGELHVNPGFEDGWHTVNQPCGTETGIIGDGWMAWDDGCWGNPYLYFDSAPAVCEGEHAQAVEYTNGSEGFYNLVEGLTPGKTYLVSGCIRIDSPATWWAEFGVSDADPPAPGAGCTSPDDPYPADPWLWKSDGWGLGPPPGVWYNVGPYRCTPVGTMLLVWFKFGQGGGAASIGYGDAVSVVAAADGTDVTFTKHFTEAADEGPHVLTLVVTDDEGQTACCTWQFNVVLPPCDCGAITADPTDPDVGETVNFSVATVGCTPPVQYEWDFECDSVYDYTVTDDNTASHAYSSGGWVTCCARVTDGLGQSCESFFDIFVNAPPLCQIDGPTTVKAGDLACFSGAGSSDPDGGSIVSYEWDFGQPADATGLITNPSFETGDKTGWTDFGAIPLYWTASPFWACGLVTPYGTGFVVRETCQGAAQGGSYQVISGLDPTYAYRLSAHIVGFYAGDGTKPPELEWVRVGFDPNAGTDPGAGSVVWGPNAQSPDCAFDPGVTTSVDCQPTAASGTVFFMCNTGDWACIGVHALDNLVLTRLSVGSGSEACYTYSYDPLNTLVTVTLCVTDDEGSTACCTQEVEILPADNQKPICDFTYSPANPTDLDTVQFTDLSTDPDPDDAVVAWAWDFGDGGTSTDQNPTHTYADDGTYNVCLTVTDSGRGGQSDPLSATCCKDVVVSNVGPECCISGPASGQAGIELCWESCSTDADGEIVAYAWDFGEPAANLKPDGGFETGFYTPASWPCPGKDSGVVGNGWIPWVDGDCGWMGNYVYADGAPEVCEGEHSQKASFSSGSRGVYNEVGGLTPGATYMLSGCIRLDSASTYWAEFGCSTADPPAPGGAAAGYPDPWLWKQDGWGLGPPAGAWYNVGPLPVTPAGSSLIVWFKWGQGGGAATVGYGDGVTLTAVPEPVTTPVACHTYSSEGTYEVCLTVTDDDGATASCCKTVVIAENHEPDCCFTYAPAEPCDDAPVQFTDCSTDPDGDNIVAWSWTFGDGGSDTVQNPSHLYAAGSYEVCLTVTDDGTPPLSATCCQTINVCHINEPPTCEITSGPTTLARGEIGCFIATASDPEGGALTYSWDLDGGTMSLGWTDMYEGDVTPNNAGWDRYEGNFNGTSDGALWHLNDDSSNKTKFAKYPNMSGGVTVVARVQYIAASSNTNLYGPAYLQTPMGQVRCYWDPGGQNIYVRDVASGGGNYGSVPAGTWHIIRLRAGAGGTWRLHLDENPTPIATGGLDAGSTSSRLTMVGANSTGGTGEVYCDYFYTALGNYAPGQVGGPKLPGAPAGPDVCATWDTLGVKTVCLTVTDDQGATGTCCATVEIVNLLPTCSIEADPALSVVGRPTTFTATASDPDGTVVSYAWDFGDGGTDTGNPVTHTFMIDSFFDVYCVVTDNDGGTATCMLTVEANPAPECVISGPASGTTCQELCFDGSASSDPDGGVVSYCWDSVPDLAISDPSFETGAGWTVYSGGGMANSFGFCGYAPRSGAKWFGNATSWGTTNGKAYQVLGGAVAGANYTAEIWINSVSWQGSTPYPLNVHTRVGIDPAGGTDPAAAVWSPDTSNMVCGAGPYEKRSVAFTATGPNVTVFCEYWNNDAREWSMLAMDDVAVRGLCSGTDATYCKTFETCGEHTVTLTVTDDEGITSTCETTVTITDGCPPEITTCPEPRNLQADENGEAPAPDLCPEVVATDDCDEALDCTQSPAAGTMLPYGETVITLTVTDDAGLTDTCETTVTVGDGTPPEITCPDPGPYPVGEDCTVPCPAATATDNVDPDPVVTQDPAAGDPLAPGHYDIQVEACDFTGNCSTAVCPIDVVDDTAPVITCPPDITACTDPGQCSAAVDLITCVGEPVALANPGFEDGSVCGEVWGMPKLTVQPGWSRYGDTGDDCAAWPVADVFVHYPHGGAAMFHHQIGWGTGTIGVYQQVATEPGADYKFSAWAYVMDDSWCYRNYMAVDLDGGTDVNGSEVWVEIGPTDPWQQYSANFTATGATTTLFLELRFIWACAIGSLSFDDATLDKIVCSGSATATDNCGVVSLDNDAPEVFPLGTTTVTWTACDAAGNCSSCEQLVTVNDCEAPTLECPPDVEVCTDPGACEATGVALGDAMAADNCGVASLTNNAPASYPLGVTTVTWTACDDAGNCTSCDQTVTVSDCEPPAITCPADAELCTDSGVCESTGDIGTATATDNCGVASIANDAPAAFPLGTTVVTWTATDTSGNTASCTQNVTVSDCEAPSITCPDDVTACTDPGACTATVDLGMATASDNCGVTSLDNDAPAVFPVGTTVVTWTACDAAGNCTSCTQNVTVSDCEAPSITCPDDIDTCTDPGVCTATVDLGMATASDNCGVVSLTNDGLAAYPVGVTTVTWTACDAAGNCASCEQTVTVSDCEPPSITCPPDVTVVSPECEPMAVDIGQADASDNCGVASLSNDAPALFAPGATVVKWTACDAAGNCSSCEQLVTVLCPPTCDITYTPASPTTDDVITFDSGASDPDGTIVSVAWTFGDGGTASSDPATHQYAMPGPYTVTVTVCDDDGLCATCYADVAVGKGTNIPPECGEPPITVDPIEPAVNQAVTFTSNAYDPNPWGVIVSYDWDFGDGDTGTGNPATHTYTAVGTYTVCVVVTDDQGGTATCCTQVTVTEACFCSVAIDKQHSKLPAFGQVGQCKQGQIGARNLGAEPCDVVLRVIDNVGVVVYEGTATIPPYRRIRHRFTVCATDLEVGRNMWTWEVWPVDCKEQTPTDNVYMRRVMVRPGLGGMTLLGF